MIVLEVEVEFWLFDASQFWKVRLVASIVTLKSFGALFLIVTALRVDYGVASDEEYGSRTHESNYPHGKGNSFFKHTVDVLVPQLEQVLVVSKESFEFRHMRASLLC